MPPPALRTIAIVAGVIAGFLCTGTILGLTIGSDDSNVNGSIGVGSENVENDAFEDYASGTTRPSSSPSLSPVKAASDTLTFNPTTKIKGPKRKPNILLILADDLGTGDIPAYFNTSMVHMPNLNRLVAKGVTFKDVHSTPLCAPSRYMLLSGLYAHRGRNKGGSWSLKDNGNQFRGDQKSIAQTLRDGAKYNTFMTGKWHMGAKAPPNGLYDYSQTLTHPMHDWSKALIDGPQDIGFESSFITIGGIQAPPYSFFRDGFLTTKSSDVVYWENDSEHDMQCGRSIIGKESGEGSNDWDSTAYNMILVNETIGFVDKHLESKPENPFFAYVALGGVHIPHSPPGKCYCIDRQIMRVGRDAKQSKYFQHVPTIAAVFFCHRLLY
jgi:arylsulfatase A-like enzyme